MYDSVIYCILFVCKHILFCSIRNQKDLPYLHLPNLWIKRIKVKMYMITSGSGAFSSTFFFGSSFFPAAGAEVAGA
jgi:hypothetical protein